MSLANLAVQVPFYGIIFFWVLALIPAAVITALRGRWALFFAGWVTLGATWLIGAAGLLRRRSAPVIALSLTGVLAAIAVTGLLAARPSPVLGVDGATLGNSVGGLLTEAGPCTPRDDDAWRCARYHNPTSSNAEYRVEVDRVGCWTATRILYPDRQGRERFAGCVTIVDHLS